MWTVREHSFLSFWKHYGNTTFECFLHILKQMLDEHPTKMFQKNVLMDNVKMFC